MFTPKTQRAHLIFYILKALSRAKRNSKSSLLVFLSISHSTHEQSIGLQGGANFKDWPAKYGSLPCRPSGFQFSSWYENEICSFCYCCEHCGQNFIWISRKGDKTTKYEQFFAIFAKIFLICDFLRKNLITNYGNM